MEISYSEIIEKIKQAVVIASSIPNMPEAKLRELVAPIWNEAIRLKKINLNFAPRDERQLANGRADTVFNRLILEYKKPGHIKPNNEKNRKLIAQVKGYIEDLAKEERWKEERLLGIAFDGVYFLHIRKVGRWIEEEPVLVSEKSIEKFLLTLEKLTTKAALVPDNLIRDFAIGTGSLNYIASNSIKAFYFALCNNANKRVGVFFDQWALQFSEVHGSIESKKFDTQILFKSYGFKKEEQNEFNFLAFFFALDTYFGLLMKLLAYQVVSFYTLRDVAGLPLADWEKLDTAAIREKLINLEEGGIFRSLGIRNFLEGDLLSWYLNDWNEKIERAIRGIIERLNQYDPETMELVPEETRDILKKLYQFLVPKQIRHDLGEYYTPDWLAERCLNQVGYGAKDKTLAAKRLLDPGCGSATFLILAIKRLKEHGRINGIEPGELLNLITRNIVGFELNPLAVIAARTNYLLAVADLLRYKTLELTIPVYLCDSINPPQARVAGEMTLFEEKIPYEVKTAVGNFYFPHDVVSRQGIQKLANLIEDGVKKGQPSDSFLLKVQQELQLPTNDFEKTDSVLLALYEKMQELEEKGINGIWARIIKNAFAPLFVGQFDIIVGNPPWVNWEALPQDYRIATGPIWQHYNLFEHTGLRARLGSAKDDISILMTYVAIDKYLKNRGKLCIVITQTLFKTTGGGEGFRRFRLGRNGSPFKVIQVDDMTDLQPFDMATNRTAVFYCQKGEVTSYPVEYHIWRKKGKGSISSDLSWEEVQIRTETKYFKAQSIDGSDQGSWITARAKGLQAMKKIIGPAEYKAREGTNTGGANGIYWLRILKKSETQVLVENLYDIGKRKVQSVEMELEEELIYPLLRGRDLHRWHAMPSCSIILPHQKDDPSKGIPEARLITDFPKTYKYFDANFRESLKLRKSSALPKDTFYSIFGIGPYTFAPFKLVWKEQATELECAVISLFKEKIIIPDHKLMMIPFVDEFESHYVCSVLNSKPARLIVLSYAINTQLGLHLLENIKIPKYDTNNSIHRKLVQLSLECHEKVAAGISVIDVERQVDEITAELWTLNKEELRDIFDSLEEML